MEVSERFRQYLAARPGKTFNKDGYSIKVAMPSAILYSAGDRQLTLTGEFFQERGELVDFLGVTSGIYLEDPLRWDNVEEAMPLEDAQMALTRIKSLLDQQRFKYQFIPSTRSPR